MSFWDSIVGLFTGDTYFPDNPKREARLKQLNLDCQLYINESKGIAQEMKNKMEAFNENLLALYPESQKIPSDWKLDSSICEKIPFDELSGIFSPLLSIPVLGAAWIVAETVLEAKNGDALAASLTATLGVAAMYYSGGMFFGVFPVSFLAFGAIEGAAKRDELKKLIPQAADARRKIYTSYYVNKYFSEQLDVLINTISTTKSLGYTEEQLREHINECINKIKNDMENALGQATEDLKKKDQASGAWTNEDGI